MKHLQAQREKLLAAITERLIRDRVEPGWRNLRVADATHARRRDMKRVAELEKLLDMEDR